MRISAFAIAGLLVGSAFPSAAATASSSSLINAIQRCLAVSTFDGSCIGTLSTVVVIDQDHRHAFDRDEQIEYFERMKSAKSLPKISQFKMLAEIDDGAFVSVSYRYLLTTEANQSAVRSEMVAHDVWEHGPSGWSRVTGVVRRTVNTR